MFLKSHDIDKDSTYFNIYTEFLSYYNTYLFIEHLLTKNISSDALIAKHYILINTIDVLKDVLSVYQEKGSSLEFFNVRKSLILNFHK